MAEAPATFHCSWRGDFTNLELNALHAAAFEHAVKAHDWRGQVERWSLGWVTARGIKGKGEEEDLVGFVNLAWDGSQHAFVLDTAVAPRARRRGIARALVAVAQREAAAAGCAWLHVDFIEELRPFYLDACDFTPTAAGIFRLAPVEESLDRD